MFKKIVTNSWVFLLASLGAAPAVLAQSGSYLGGNLNFVDVEDDQEASVEAVSGRFGKFLNANISAEGRLGFGYSGDTVRMAGLPIDVELENMIGGYLRAGVPVAQSLYPYAALGYSRVEVDMSSPFGGGSDTESGVSYGVGLDLDLGDGLVFNIEYMNYVDKDALEVAGVSAGITIGL